MNALLVALAILLAFLCGVAFLAAVLATGAALENTQETRKDNRP